MSQQNKPSVHPTVPLDQLDQLDQHQTARLDRSRASAHPPVPHDQPRLIHVEENRPTSQPRMLPGTTVYISRAIPRFGLERSPFDIPWTTPNAKRRPSSLRRYRNYVLAQPELIRLLPDLRGKTLVCWCRRSDEERTDANTCHGDILLDILDFHTDEDFEALATRIEKEITAAQSLTNVPGSNSAISEVITIQGRRYVALLKRETGGWQFTLHARDLFLNFDDGLDALHWINHALRDESNGTFGSSLDQ